MSGARVGIKDTSGGTALDHADKKKLGRTLTKRLEFSIGD